MKGTLKQKVCSAAVLAGMLAAFTAFSCNNGAKLDKNGLTKLQREKITAVAEAFFENGKELNENTPLAMTDIERLVYYLYNGELTPGEDGYASVSAEDAEARIEELLGIKKLKHTGRKNGENPDFYYEDGKYYLKTNKPAAEKIDFVSVEKNENGNILNIDLNVKSDSVGEARFSCVFSIEGDSVQLMTIKRFDEK